MGRCYPHLSLDERRKIANWRYANVPVVEIAHQLSRDPSTIYREIKRNSVRFDDQLELNGYHAVAAQNRYEQRSAPQVDHLPQTHDRRAQWVRRGMVAGTDRRADAARTASYACESRDDLPICLLERWPCREVLPTSATPSAQPETAWHAQTPW